jgi:hypothetical protein
VQCTLPPTRLATSLSPRRNAFRRAKDLQLPSKVAHFAAKVGFLPREIVHLGIDDTHDLLE